MTPPPPPPPPPAAAASSSPSPRNNHTRHADTRGYSSPATPQSVESPFRVLGIGLVAEEVGKGARLVFRYPAAAPPDAAATRSTSDSGNGGSPSSGQAQSHMSSDVPQPAPSPAAAAAGTASSARQSASASDAANLFFTLNDRTMAKLFRPKHPLCGQPMTLSIGGTVFCCRAVLLPADTVSDSAAAGGGAQSPPKRNNTEEAAKPSTGNVDSSSHGEGMSAVAADSAAAAAAAADSNIDGNTSSSSASPDKKTPKLVLFSVIVALVPVKGYGRIFRDDGSSATTLLQEAVTPDAQSSPYMPSPRKYTSQSQMGAGGLNNKSSSRRRRGSDEHAGDGLSSASFLAIRRIHISLSRLCRVLEREERRCSYVATQSAAFLKILSDMKDVEAAAAAASSSSRHGRAGSSGSGGGGTGNNTDPGPSPGGSTATKERAGTDSKLPRPRHVRGGSLATAMSIATAPSISIPSTPISRPGTLGSHNRDISVMTAGSVGTDGYISTAQRNDDSEAREEIEQTRKQEEERQATIELMFAYNASEERSEQRPDHSSRIHGNLAREIAQVFHALSRNDGNAVFSPTPSSLLSSREGIVYINRHLAVPVEPASSSQTDGFEISGSSRSLDSPGHHKVVRPYHTLIFPHASPAQMVKAIFDETASKLGGLDGLQASSTTSAPFDSSHLSNQRLQRLLLMANPTKSLSEIAVDAALTVPVTLNLASYLIECGSSTLSHVATRSIRYAVSSAGMARVHALALPFSQRFDRSIPIFLAVAALTSSGQTLGEVLSSASSGKDEYGIGRRIVAIKTEGHVGHHQDRQQRTTTIIGRPRGSSFGHSDLVSPPGQGPVDTSTGISADEIEDYLFEIALWLRSHSVVVEMHEYLVKKSQEPKPKVTPPSCSTSNDEKSTNGGKKSGARVKRLTAEQFLASSMWNDKQSVLDASARASVDEQKSDKCEEEMIFEELSDIGDCLSGTISTIALCWKYGLDSWRLKKLIEWGVAEGKLEVIRRIPYPGDDWGTV